MALIFFLFVILLVVFLGIIFWLLINKKKPEKPNKPKNTENNEKKVEDTQYMQRSSVSLIVNLVGLKESVFNILGFQDNKEGRDILNKVIETAIDVAAKKGKELGDTVAISMTETEGSSRFANLDGEKYGKNSALSIESDSYSQGIVLKASEIGDYTSKTDIISECNKLSKLLNGGLLVRLDIDQNANQDHIKKSIEKAAELTSSFKPVKKVALCGECGFKDEPFVVKCPKCKSSY